MRILTSSRNSLASMPKITGVAHTISGKVKATPIADELSETPSHAKEFQGFLSVIAAYKEGFVDETKVLRELQCQIDYTTISTVGRQQLITVLNELRASFREKCTRYEELCEKFSDDIERQGIRASVVFNFFVLQLVSEQWKRVPRSIRAVGARLPLW